MKTTFQSYKQLLLSGALVLSFAISFAVSETAIAQHEGHQMPGMSEPKPKPKTTPRRKAKPKTRRKVSRQKPNAQKAKGTPMPAGHKHTPGMVMPSPTASPAPTVHEHTPGMVMPSPASSPAPTGVPQVPAGQHDMHLPTPAMTPAPSGSPGKIETHAPDSHPSPTAKPAHDPAHDAMDHSKMNEAQPATKTGSSMPGMDMTGTHAMGPLMVMSGNEMSVRVGSSETNVMPMGQMGSGTSWTPATTPMHMIHKQSGDWLLMLHYNAIVGVNSQGGPRGVTKFESANWIMPMAFRKLGKGTLQLRGMFSFEPFTFPPGGSPLLFQTGETYQGRPIIDAQHPHDLFMELSAQYTHPLGERTTWFAYFGYPGELALGPTAFMHGLLLPRILRRHFHTTWRTHRTSALVY